MFLMKNNQSIVTLSTRMMKSPLHTLEVSKEPRFVLRKLVRVIEFPK